MFLYLSQTMAVVFYVKMQNPYTSKIKLKELQEMFYIVCVECFVRQAGYDTCMQHLIKTFGFVGMAECIQPNKATLQNHFNQKIQKF